MTNKSQTQQEVKANPQTSSKWWHVDPKLLLLKAHFFFFFGSLAAVIPPIILYSQQLGLSMSMVGTLFAALPFIQCVAKAVGGAVADKFQIHKSVFIFGIMVMAASTFSLNFIPKIDINLSNAELLFESTEVQVACHSDDPGSASLRLTACDNRITEPHSNNDTWQPPPASCHLTCDTSSDEESSNIRNLFCGDATEPGCSEYNSTHSFFNIKEPRSSIVVVEIDTTNATGHRIGNCTWYNVGNITLLESQFHPTNTTVQGCPSRLHDAFSLSCSARCYSAPRQSNRTESVSSTVQVTWLWLGCITTWSMFGVVLSIADAILVSSLGDNQGDFGKSRLFASVGWGLISPIAAYLIEYFSEGLEVKNYVPGFYMFFALILCDLAIAVPMKVKISEVRPEKLLKEVIATFRHPPVFVFLLAVFFEGVATGVMWTFAVVYANELNSNALVIGLTFAVECFISEIPLFWVSGWIVNKLGHATSLSCALLFTGLKSLLYSVISDAWYMLPIGLIHGVTYAMLYATMATYANKVAPPGACATLQGIFQGAFEGVGVGVGNFVGGITYDHYGGRMTFRIFGFWIIGMSALYQLYTYVCARRNSNKHTLDLPVS